MAVPTGTASMLDIQNEFGGSNPISLSEYYGAASGIPASGTISINNFRGKSNISMSYVTQASSYDWGGSSTNFTMPTGIQAGDILVAAQVTSMDSGDGYAGPQDGYGSGFTPAPNGQAGSTTVQNLYIGSGFYGVTDVLISYKVATGAENGATISGFQASNSPYGTAYTRRQLYVFRPTNSGTLTPLQGGTAAYTYPNTLSRSLTPSTATAHAGVAVFVSSAYSQSATLSGGVSSYVASTSTNMPPSGTHTVFFGAFIAPLGTSPITLAAPSGSYNANLVTLSTYGNI